MHTDPWGREVLKALEAGKFIETLEAGYQPIYDYAKNIGIDISAFRYQ
jgi:hypothetical protein